MGSEMPTLPPAYPPPADADDTATLIAWARWILAVHDGEERRKASKVGKVHMPASTETHTEGGEGGTLDDGMGGMFAAGGKTNHRKRGRGRLQEGSGKSGNVGKRGGNAGKGDSGIGSKAGMSRRRNRGDKAGKDGKTDTVCKADKVGIVKKDVERGMDGRKDDGIGDKTSLAGMAEMCNSSVYEREQDADADELIEGRGDGSADDWPRGSVGRMMATRRRGNGRGEMAVQSSLPTLQVRSAATLSNGSAAIAGRYPSRCRDHTTLSIAALQARFAAVVDDGSAAVVSRYPSRSRTRTPPTIAALQARFAAMVSNGSTAMVGRSRSGTSSSTDDRSSNFAWV